MELSDAAKRQPGNLLAAAAFVAVVVVGISANIAGGGMTAEAAAAPQTLRKAMWGDGLVGPSIYDKYQDLGVGIYQMPARWNEIAPTKPANPTNPNDPAYKWPIYLQENLEEAVKKGMKFQIMIIGVPGWANGGKSWKNAPTNPADFGDFAAALEKKYPVVDIYMIWDEPNRKAVFAPLTPAKYSSKGKLNKAQARAPRIYSQMLDAAYAALKALDPQNLVIGGTTYTGAGAARAGIPPVQWIRYMKLPGGKRPRMDLYGHNPSTYRMPNFKAPPSPQGIVEFSDLKRLAKELDKNFKGKKLRLYLAEWGIATGYGIRTPGTGTQVKWMNRAFRLLERWKRVFTVSWITPIDRIESGINLIGLLDEQGNPTALYHAFKSGF